jgi:hypothetical protein
MRLQGQRWCTAFGFVVNHVLVWADDKEAGSADKCLRSRQPIQTSLAQQVAVRVM